LAISRSMLLIVKSDKDNYNYDYLYPLIHFPV